MASTSILISAVRTSGLGSNNFLGTPKSAAAGPSLFLVMQWYIVLLDLAH